MVALRRGDVRRAARRIAQALIYRAPFELSVCPACASSDLDDLDLLPLRPPRAGRYIGFVTLCDSCGLVFSNPLPSFDDLKRFYSPDGEWRSGIEAAPATTDVAPRGLSWSKPFDPIRGELRVTRPPKGARVLDFGCGTGKLLDAFQDFGWDTCGIEPACDDAFRRHQRLEAVPDTPSFDLIVANHVLEHVPDPLNLLGQFARACRMPGFVFVSVPRFDTLPVHRDYAYVLNGRAHITAYTWTCLQGLLTRSGFDPVSEPPERVAKGRGKTTASRLRVIGRRVAVPAAVVARPADAARDAMKQYLARVPDRSLLERLGLSRVAARRADALRRRAARVRKSAKIRSAVS